MAFSTLDSELTGPLFTTEAMRAVFSDRARLAAMLRTEAALARALARHGLAREELAGAIETIVPEDLDLAELGRDTAIAGVPSIPFVKAVQLRLPAELAADFHKGATTQDILDTAQALQVGEALALVAADLDCILAALSDLARTHRSTPCIGRSYGQHAAPTAFGYTVAVWLAGIAETAAALPRIRQRTLAVSLGGPVGTLAGLGEAGIPVLETFADELGLAAPAITWHALRARIAETGFFLATLVGTLAKMATDIAHLASTEVGEVAEPYAPGRGGSSAMPHKRNPLSATLILAALASAKSLVLVLLDAMAALHERPLGTWHAEWTVLPQLFGLAAGALAQTRTLAEGLEIDTARMHVNLEMTRGLIFADAAAARLAPLLGRQRAHEIVAAAADQVRRTAQSLREVLWEDPTLAPDAQKTVDAAFDLAPAVTAATRFVDRALAEAQAVRLRLAPKG